MESMQGMHIYSVLGHFNIPHFPPFLSWPLTSSCRTSRLISNAELSTCTLEYIHIKGRLNAATVCYCRNWNNWELLPHSLWWELFRFTAQTLQQVSVWQSNQWPAGHWPTFLTSCLKVYRGFCQCLTNVMATTSGTVMDVQGKIGCTLIMAVII